MNRRGFLRGAISVMAVAAILKGRVAESGQVWGFGLAPVKEEGAAISYDPAREPSLSVITEWRLTDKNQWYLSNEHRC